MDSNAERAKLDAIEQQMNPYTDPNLASKTQAAVMQAWNPLLQNATQATQNQMSDFGSRFYNLTNDGLAGGTDAASLSPAQKMAYLQGQLGNMAGQLQASGSLADYYGGRAQDMSANSLNAIQMAYQALRDRYAGQSQNYQTALQMDAARRAQGSGGFNIPAPPQGATGGGNFVSQNILDRFNNIISNTSSNPYQNLSAGVSGNKLGGTVKYSSGAAPTEQIYQQFYEQVKQSGGALPETFWTTPAGQGFMQWGRSKGII